MAQENLESSAPGTSSRRVKGPQIPGIRPLADSITTAHQSGVLFFLAVEVELQLAQYFRQNGLPPTPIDLEAILTEAAKALLGE